MKIFLIFNFSANLAIIFDFADESIVFHEYAGACSHPACRTGTTDQRTDIVTGGQSATRKMTQLITAQSKTSSSTSSQIDRTCCQDGSQRTFTHRPADRRHGDGPATPEVRGPSRIGQLTGDMRRSCHTRSQRTFTRVKVKSRVDQAGMPSIFDEP